MSSPIYKGDTIVLEFTIESDVTGWKIRAQLSDDCGNCIRLATSNVTGGSDDQIQVTSTSVNESTFEVKIPSDETSCFKQKSRIEVEVETNNTIGGKPEKRTIIREAVKLENQDIDWDSVSS